MTPVVQGADRGRRGWPVLCAVVLGLASLNAKADLWSIANSSAVRFESNDNVALSQNPAGTVNTLSLSNAFKASRQMENSRSGLDADATLVRQQGAGGQSRVDGQLGLTHSLNDPLNNFNFAMLYSQDFNNLVRTADVLLGQGQRRSTALSAAWSRSLSERLSANAQLSIDQTRYGQQLSGAAVDFRDTALSAGISYALSEVSTGGLQLSRSSYRPAGGTNRSDTDKIKASLSRVMTDRSSASVSLGLYRTDTTTLAGRLACPLAVSFCNAGVVPFVVVVESVDSSRRGLEFSASHRYQWNEITESSISIGRQQVPSGAGTLVRSDTLSAAVSRGFSPTVNGSMSYARSRSTLQQGANAAQPGQWTLSALLSKQLAPDLSVQAAYQRTSADRSTFTSGAQSNSVSVSLKYDWPRIDSSR